MDQRLSLDDLTPALLMASWTKVRSNAGSYGVDGVSVEVFERQAECALPELAQEMVRGDYVPLPLRKIMVEKKPGSRTYRTLLVPVVRDRVAQTAVARLLTRAWEDEFLNSSFAYRRGRGVDLAVEQIIAYRDQGFRWVFDADITAYFDSIPHHSLEKRIAGDADAFPFIDLLRNWIHAQVWDGRRCAALKRGIPQGSPISPLLANFFLTELDRLLESGEGRPIRYADDFIVLTKTEEAAQTARDLAGKWLQSKGLELHPEKTAITSFDRGFHYLGVAFRGDEVSVPWKAHSRIGRVVFSARIMSRSALRAYRESYQHSKPSRPHRTPVSVPQAREQFPKEDVLPFLYITQPGSILRKAGGRFLVELDQHVLLDVPAHKVDNLMLFGNVQITTQALIEALDHEIPVSFLTRYGRFRGKVSGEVNRNVHLRLAQYRLYEDTALALELARRTVARKISNGIEVLARYEERDRSEDLTEEARNLMRQQVEKVAGADSLAAIDGHEGAAASAYFSALMTYNRSPFSWHGRIKHPAPDPLNALLSLGYSLLTQEVLALIEIEDLDPALGFLHEVDSNRPSLALDLVEPFRHPIIDRLVLAMVNRHMFNPGDFSDADEGEGIHLKQPSLQRFLSEYERWMLAPVSKQEGAPPVRRMLSLEVEKFAGVLRQTDSWRPFPFPWTAAPEEPCTT